MATGGEVGREGWACYKHGIRCGPPLKRCCKEAVDLNSFNGQLIEERICREDIAHHEREAERRSR